MSKKSILKSILSVAGNFIPAVKIINSLIPSGQPKLPADASKVAITRAYNALPPEAQAQADDQLELQLGLEKEKTSQIRVLAEADMAGASTRPEIAKLMAWVVALETAAFTLFFFWVLVQEGVDGIKSLGELWMIFGVLTGIPSVILRTYFVARKEEKQHRYAHAYGANPIASGISGLISAWRGK